MKDMRAFQFIDRVLIFHSLQTYRADCDIPFGHHIVFPRFSFSVIQESRVCSLPVRIMLHIALDALRFSTACLMMSIPPSPVIASTSAPILPIS